MAEVQKVISVFYDSGILGRTTKRFTNLKDALGYATMFHGMYLKLGSEERGFQYYGPSYLVKRALRYLAELRRQGISGLIECSAVEYAIDFCCRGARVASFERVSNQWVQTYPDETKRGE